MRPPECQYSPRSREESIVYQVTTGRCDVNVEAFEDAVHLALRIARADVELERQALRHHQSLGSPSGDDQAAAAEVLP